MGVNPQNMGKVKRYESKCKQYAGHIQKHTVPMRKEQIIEQVRKQNASSDIIEDLQMLPDQEYESPDSLMQAMESVSQRTGQGVGGKSQGFGGTGTGGSGGGGSSTGGSSQSFGGRGGA